MKYRNWFWGIFLLVAGLFVIASQVGAFIHVGIWTLIVTMLLAAAVVASLPERNFFGIFVPLALLYLVYQHPLRLPLIHTWPLLLGALLLSAGCSVIIPGRLHHGWHGHHGCHGHHGNGHDDDGPHSRFSQTEETTDGNEILIHSRFAETSKYVHSDSLKQAELNLSFGSLRVYFDQARLSPEGAEIDVHVSFGEMVLYFPQEWRVIDNVQGNLGDVSCDSRRAEPAADAPTVRITGSVSFGDLNIHYV